MDLTKDEERWAVWMVQAQRFARRQNFSDAVRRMQLTRDAIRQALSDATDPNRRQRLQLLLARADEQLATLRAQYEAWRSKIAAQRQHTIDHAAEEMLRPLPKIVD